MRENTIDKKSGLYAFLQVFIIRPSHKLFYRKLEVHGYENIPENSPLIFTPNHQNALMDALSLVYSLKSQPVFLARADLFKLKKVIVNILKSFKIMPIYRIRDGIDNVRRNDEVFNITNGILRRNISPLVMFPEGNHGDKKRLRPLVKGIFRIAFQAQEEYKDKPYLKIVPVCLDYEIYQRFQAKLYIEFGNPIEVNEYYTDYAENPAVGINKLKDRLSDELKKLIIHVENEELYDVYFNSMLIYYNELQRKRITRLKSLKEKKSTDKKVIGILDRCKDKSLSTFNIFKNKIRLYQKELNHKKLNDWVLSENKNYMGLKIIAEIILFIPGFPVFVFGFFGAIIPYLIIETVKGKIKDQQFHSSIKYGLGLILYILFILLFLPLTILFIKNFLFIIVFFILMPFIGILTYRYKLWFKKLILKIRFAFNKRKVNYIKLIKLRRDILLELNRMMTAYSNE